MSVKIVAETGASHRKSYARCLALINAVSQTGADAIKFSAFKADEMTVNSDEPPFVINKEPWNGMSFYNLYKSIEIPYNWLRDLRKASMSVNLGFILGVYHPNTVPILKELGVKTVKIASFELNYTDLLAELAKEPYIRNVILSTGGATEDEIKTALEILKDKDITLLYCVSSYPAKPEEMNLATMTDMKKFGVKVGLSNHTRTLTVPAMAVTLGACMVETHIKLDDEGLDSSFAVFPDGFKAVSDVIRQAESIMGQVGYDQPKSYHRKDMEGKMVRVVW